MKTPIAYRRTGIPLKNTKSTVVDHRTKFSNCQAAGTLQKGLEALTRAFLALQVTHAIATLFRFEADSDRSPLRPSMLESFDITQQRL